MTREPAAERTPLEERLIALIRANGPITVADYMADALGHPHEGYYMRAAPIGAAGDFTTAPEISQIFGELIGLWLVQSWLDIGQPATFNLVELGPGRGVLMVDILRAASVRPAFLDAATLWLVETSGRLRHEQQQRLRSFRPRPLWADEFADIPPDPTLIVANELFDCLPVRQFERAGAGWRERLIGVAPDGEALAFVHAKTPPPPEIDLPSAEETPEGAIFEICEPGRALAAEIAAFLVENGGRALIIDYGHIASGLGDTLQAVRRHRYWPVLASPGLADITAHVDFEALSRAALDAGAAVWGPVPQGTFLDRLGLALRVERLCAGKTAEEALAIRQGAHRIAAPEQMGEVFKAMCIASPDLPPPAGFEAP
ncbi:class I SAM-dependent methyltransferase [Amphiplicatus metriothermophilus]|uniref:SAM-dependent methyltransferase, MidA family n=1 Tax=Amphiplicatus metriothermophilus TaxID=1519374 RepID=A0A239PZ03_9PROT|nr:SAM-dependent methyltransferase [Amphiplicatus metriothermophilus]MBB5519998.1 NADH dehydrogenase [ubiquinone] 1 alpha subcomplex assembly factor 7 [Amphiplicatus metriothermophilus]SNT74897.1 SAM-dependent methyltransferase, MidA family [Amphiplicatus metriothermophilus]